MNLKGTLGGIAVMLALGIFYIFAFCMVEDVEAEDISAEYYYSMETEAQTSETAAENGEDLSANAEKPKHDTEVTSVTAVTVADHSFAGGNDADKAENDDNETETSARTETSKAAETEKAPAPRETEAQTKATEEYIPPAVEDEEDDTELYEEDDISDGGYDTEPTAAETEETTFSTFPEEDDEAYLAIFRDNPFAEESDVSETAVSVDVSVGADISTSETFTAKFNGSTQTVNAYDLICWIVNNEMSPSFSDEAIKAQAVAAYSYVKYHNVNGLTPSVLVKKNPSDRIKNLVSEVWGVCCYYNGSVAQTVYMASSSGYTADAKNVWGGSVPYLKSVACPFDIGNDPNYGSTMKVSESSMRNMLESALGISLSNNPYNWLKVRNYVDGNYVYELSVDGQKTISGRKLRETVMGHKLKSAAFEVSYSDGEFIFTTYGYGHGVGMSQNGANILAKQGYSYYEILNYYFTGIEII